MRLHFIVCTALLAAPLVSGGSTGPARRRSPLFTLEQATQVRTLGQFAVSPDGRLAAFGLAGHYFGFPVVPRFGEDNNLWIVSLDDGEIRQATSGSEPKLRPVFAPSSDRLAFESENDIWIVGLGDGRITRVTTSSARDEQVAWSPDGREVVFVSNRGARTDLWVASAAGERHGLRRLTDDLRVEHDPQWSPDGRTVTYSAADPGEFYAQGVFAVSAQGWQPRRLTPDDEFDHSTARWSPDGRRLAILSDRSGYTHVWVIDAAGEALGGPALHLDTGPYDSTSPHFRVQPVWSRDGSRILVSLNRQASYDLVVLDVEQRRVDLVGGSGGRYHEIGWRHDGGIVYAHETACAPPDIFILEPGGTTRRMTSSSHLAFRCQHMAVMKRVSFAAQDGLMIPALLLTPRDLTGGERLPAIVGLHPNAYGQFYNHWNPFVHYLAASGYILLLVDQRGSSGYGREFRTAQIGQWGRGTLEDVKAAAAYLKRLPFVDADRVGVIGMSFGGYQALLALTKVPSLFRAAVVMMAPTDRRGRRGDLYRALQIGATEDEDPALYERISPITSVAAIRVPLLILHSDQDRNVEPEETYRFVDELERHKKPFEVKIYRNEGHGLADPANQLDSYKRIVAFFERWLASCGGAPGGS